MKKLRNFWTKDKCKEEAKKYDYRLEFQKNSKGAYLKAYRNQWLDEMCCHMKIVGDRKHRCIYVYEFSDNSAYIGLTFNIEDRHRRHLKKGSVYDYKLETGINYELKQLTDYLTLEIAIRREEEYVKNNNWQILNKVKTGSLGGNTIKWTKKECQKEALKYENRVQFQKNSKGAYLKAWRTQWLNEICRHMKEIKKPNGYWNNYDNCKKESKKYKNRTQFAKCAAYNVSRKNKWLEEFFPKIPHNI